MKKTYEAPAILFEDFTLSTNIAGNCEVLANQSENTCGLQWGRFTVFTSDMVGICNRIPQETAGLYDELCYHVPEETYNLFNS